MGSITYAGLCSLFSALQPKDPGWEFVPEFGLWVYWGGQKDRESFVPHLRECSRLMGEQTGFAGELFLLGAKIVFIPVGTANKYCMWPPTPTIVACYAPSWDIIYIEEGPTIADTYLCHEVGHRVKYLMSSCLDTDFTHADQPFFEATESIRTKGE